MIFAKIKSIRPIENEPRSAVSLEICRGGEKEQKKLVVHIDFCPENGIGVGPIDENTLSELEYASKLCEAVSRGESILGFAANSESVLVSKLKRRGFDQEIANEAARILAERGLVDDCESALADAERCVKKLWGPKRILVYLRQRGYRDRAIEEARAYLEDVDFISLCRMLIVKKYRQVVLSPDRREQEKAVAALVRYGYSLSVIRIAMSRAGADIDGIYD